MGQNEVGGTGLKDSCLGGVRPAVNTVLGGGPGTGFRTPLHPDPLRDAAGPAAFTGAICSSDVTQHRSKPRVA